MRVIAFIDHPEVVEKILRHLNLWLNRESKSLFLRSVQNQNQIPISNSALTRRRCSRVKILNVPGRFSSRWMKACEKKINTLFENIT